MSRWARRKRRRRVHRRQDRWRQWLGYRRRYRNHDAGTRGICGLESEHLGHICRRRVVGPHRPLLTGAGAQVSTGLAEVGRGRGGCVIDVERVIPAIAVSVGAVDRPRRRDELHRADRMVVGGVAVETPAVGVADNDAAGPVEPDAHDRRRGQAVAVQGRAGKSPVIRLHPSDRGEQRPGDSAGRVSGRRRPSIGVECRGRNAAGSQDRHCRGIGRSNRGADRLVRERDESPPRARRERRGWERRGRGRQGTHARWPGRIGRDGSKRSAGRCDSFARRPSGDRSSGYRSYYRDRDKGRGKEAMITPSAPRPARQPNGGVCRTVS